MWLRELISARCSTAHLIRRGDGRAPAPASLQCHMDKEAQHLLQHHSIHQHAPARRLSALLRYILHPCSHAPAQPGSASGLAYAHGSLQLEGGNRKLKPDLRQRVQAQHQAPQPAQAQARAPGQWWRLLHRRCRLQATCPLQVQARRCHLRRGQHYAPEHRPSVCPASPLHRGAYELQCWLQQLHPAAHPNSWALPRAHWMRHC